MDTGDPDEAVEQILEALWCEYPAVIVPSPPGAGKSGTVERAIYAVGGLQGKRVIVACATNTQVADLALRTSKAYPQIRVGWVTRKGFDPNAIPDAPKNLFIQDSLKDTPENVSVIFATTKKWQTTTSKQVNDFLLRALARKHGYSLLEDLAEACGVPLEEMEIAEAVRTLEEQDNFVTLGDLLVVDEAWQCHDTDFSHIAWLASRYLLVGDPGQIAPVITVDYTRWRHLPSGPHTPAPVALLNRYAHQSQDTKNGNVNPVKVVQLPATRRFGKSTVDVVQPAFYPNLPFHSIRTPRSLSQNEPVRKSEENDINKVFQLLSSNQEIVGVELPESKSGLNDVALANVIAEMIHYATENLTVTFQDHKTHKTETHPIAAKDIGVVCAHIAQVASVQAALGEHHEQVWVDTAERWQGSERELMFVWDPLSGKTDLTDFSKDAGRLCVMLSRHKSGCVFVTRENTEEMLRYAAVGDDRILSPDVNDPHFQAWKAQSTFREQMKHFKTLIKEPKVTKSIEEPTDGRSRNTT